MPGRSNLALVVQAVVAAALGVGLGACRVWDVSDSHCSRRQGDDTCDAAHPDGAWSCVAASPDCPIFTDELGCAETVEITPMCRCPLGDGCDVIADVDTADTADTDTGEPLDPPEPYADDCSVGCDEGEVSIGQLGCATLNHWVEVEPGETIADALQRLDEHPPPSGTYNLLRVPTTNGGYSEDPIIVRHDLVIQGLPSDWPKLEWHTHDAEPTLTIDGATVFLVNLHISNTASTAIKVSNASLLLDRTFVEGNEKGIHVTSDSSVELFASFVTATTLPIHAGGGSAVHATFTTIAAADSITAMECGPDNVLQTNCSLLAQNSMTAPACTTVRDASPITTDDSLFEQIEATERDRVDLHLRDPWPTPWLDEGEACLPLRCDIDGETFPDDLATGNPGADQIPR